MRFARKMINVRPLRYGCGMFPGAPDSNRQFVPFPFFVFCNVNVSICKCRCSMCKIECHNSSKHVWAKVREPTPEAIIWFINFIICISGYRRRKGN